MSDENLGAVFENYFAAFAKTSPSEREELMRASVADEVVFSNPGVSGRGLDNLLGHISRFQERFPGGYFEINWTRHQHGQILAEWTQFNKDGSKFITAHSYAQLNDEGRIAYFAGFWEQ